MKLNDRVAVVTGGGAGIGEAICRRFDEEGARLAVLDIRRDAAELVSRSLTHESIAIEVDVTDSDQVDRAIETVVSELGRIDVLVNNAGIAGGEEAMRNGQRLGQQIREAAEGKPQTPMEATVNITNDQFRLMMETHVFGTFYCLRAVLRHMAPRGTGAIVNIGSRCGQEGCVMLPHYSAAKGAIHTLTRAVAQDVMSQGIRVNGIAPGFIDTPINDYLPEEAIAAAVAGTPAQRMGTPAEIASVALFLACDDSSFMVGQMLAPNGGLNTSPV